MPRPRPRISLRTMMIAVAALGLLLGVEALRRRSDGFRRRALWHAMLEDRSTWDYVMVSSKVAPAREPDAPGRPPGGEEKERTEQAERSLRSAAHHGALRVKYERAANAPWLPVGPDPPSPD